MKSIRSDFKSGRNQQIYNEYVSSDTSFNRLARKYNISPQRVQFIVNDLKKKGLGIKLTLSSLKKDREEYKNAAIELREAGKLEISLEMFSKVIDWDEKNHNIRGLVDVMGHKRIAFSLMADAEVDNKKKLELLKQAEEASRKAIESAEKKGIKDLAGSIAIQKVHLVGTIIKRVSLIGADKCTRDLLEALKLVEDALKDLPGSKSHKSWALLGKTKILHLLGRKEESLDTLSEAQKNLLLGYDEEMRNKDQGRMKMRVWATGILLAASLTRVWAETR